RSVDSLPSACRDTIWTPRGDPAASVKYPGEVRVTDALVGVVFERATGSPVVRASVDLYGPRSDRVGTDTSGSFAFSALPPGRYVVVVRQFGYAYFADTVDVRQSQSTVLFAGIVGRVC